MWSPMAHYKAPTHWPGAAASWRRLAPLLQRRSTFQDFQVSWIPGFTQQARPWPRPYAVLQDSDALALGRLGADSICYNEISSRSWRARAAVSGELIAATPPPLLLFGNPCKQMQPMWICIRWRKRFKETCKKNKQIGDKTNKCSTCFHRRNIAIAAANRRRLLQLQPKWMRKRYIRRQQSHWTIAFPRSLTLRPDIKFLSS